MSTKDPTFDFLEDDSLRIPGVKSTAHPEGRDYIVPSPDMDTGIFLRRLNSYMSMVQKGQTPPAAEEQRLKDWLDRRTQGMEVDGEDMQAAAGRLILGGVWDELVADGVSWERAQRMSKFAYVAFAVSRDIALEAALSGALVGGGQGAMANRAERRAQKKKAKGKKPQASGRQG